MRLCYSSRKIFVLAKIVFHVMIEPNKMTVATVHWWLIWKDKVPRNMTNFHTCWDMFVIITRLDGKPNTIVTPLGLACDFLFALPAFDIYAAVPQRHDRSKIEQNFVWSNSAELRMLLMLLTVTIHARRGAN